MSINNLDAFYHVFKINRIFKVASTIEGKRQRFIWNLPNGCERYINIDIKSSKKTDSFTIEDDESNKNLKCLYYEIELPAENGKDKVTGYYFDQCGNLKSKNIKLDLMKRALSAQNIDLDEYYSNSSSIKIITTSLGYNLEGLPESCQKGKGEFFKCIDPFTQMYLLKYGDKIKARCYVWNEGTITFMSREGEYTNDKKLADRIYAVDGYWKEEMIKRLKEEGIDFIWSEEQNYISITDSYRAYVNVEEIRDLIKTHIEENKVPWLDSFNQYNSATNKLYIYDWKCCGYSVDENEFDSGLSNYVFLTQDGSAFITPNLVYDDLTGDMIPEDDAVYVDVGNWIGTTSSENATYSNYHSGYILDRDCYEMIVGDEIDYTYEGSGLLLADIEGKAYLISELDSYSA